MNILFASSEVFPFAKTGGLADVLAALPRALSKRAHKCRIILPFYKCVRENGFTPEVFQKGITFKIGAKEEQFSLYLLKHNGIDVYFVYKDEYFEREYLYGTPRGDYPDNALRFGFFAKAVIASLPYIGKQDILHCNDWQCGLIPLYIKLLHGRDPEFINIKILFSIHNLAYQGTFERGFMGPLGIPESLFIPDMLEFYGKLNFMKAGILYADAVNTVSEGYRNEILTPEFGCGLDGLLRTREKDLYGIINGADYSVWSPAIDKFIAKNYSGTDLAGKEICKKDVLKEFGIKGDLKKPLIGMVSRLAEQKGIDLVAEGMEQILKLDVNFILLGFGDRKYNDIFAGLAAKYKKYMGVKIGFDNKLAHKITAGADMFLIPSRYEPCGLNQLYSLKYATVPIVRRVGGLNETIEKFNPVRKVGNGFKFKEATTKAMLECIKSAVAVFEDKRLWRVLLDNCLSCDYSWDSSAEKYERLYRRLKSAS